MKKNLLILFIILLFSNWANAQTTLWQEPFDPSPQAGWSIDLPNGANDPNHGVWEVNATENGATVGTCCWNAGSNNTLHVEVQNAGNGQGNNNGAYYVGGFSMTTRRKSVTPTISTLGYNNLSLSFDYLEGGTGTADNMYLEYSVDGGATWIFLGDPSKSTDINCLSSYEWDSYTISLPSACNNIANLKIGFCWQYTSGFIGTDLSCAFNDIKIDGDTIPLQTCNIPVLSLPFNGSVIDVSGNNNNGILGGGNLPFYTTDRFGNNNSAIQLGGCGNLNWVQVPNSSTLQFNNYRYSASLWFKQCDFAGMDGWGNCVPNGGFKVMYAKAGDYCAANPSIYCGTTISATNTINVSHTNKLFSCGSGSTNNPGNYSINNTMSCYDTCEWIHLVNVVDSNVLKMYINGQLVQQQFIAAPDFSIANNQDLYFGRMFPGNWYPYGGTIDDVNFYNCAINQTTIDSLYGGYSNPLQGMAVASANNDSICISQTLQLYADTMNNATYTWTGPNGFTSTQQNPSINNFQTNNVGNYYLQVSIAGCSNSFDTISIGIKTCCHDTNYVINQSAIGPDLQNCVTLTQNSTSVVGNITFKQMVNLHQEYDKTFTLNFGCLDANGADGISFILQNQSLNYSGIPSDQVGTNSNPNQFKVEFDTYENNSSSSSILGDPTFDHIAILKNGAKDHNSINNLFGPIQASSISSNIEDCNDHIVRMYWKPTVDSFYVYFDGVKRLGVQYDILNNIFNGNPLVYATITGSTGGLGNIQKVCSNEMYLNFKTSYFIDTICQGSSYLGYNTTGTFIDTFASASGCDSVRTLNLVVNNCNPCLKPQIYFISPSSITPITNVWRMDSTGANRVQLFNDNYYRNALSLSDDGTKICYSKRLNPTNGGATGDSLWICTANSDGSGEIQHYLLPNYANYEVRNTDFNANHTGLIFNDYEGMSNRDGSIYYLDLTTNTVTMLTTNPNNAKFGPVYSRNYNKIYFSELTSGWFAFPIPGRHMDVYGNNITNFSPAFVGNVMNTNGNSFVESPNGKKVAWGESTSWNTITQLFIADTNGSNLVNIGNANSANKEILWNLNNQSLILVQDNSLIKLDTLGNTISSINATTNTTFNYVNIGLVNIASTNTINQTICQPSSYLGYSTSGTYIDTFQNQFGCDSIRTLNLVVNDCGSCDTSKWIATYNILSGGYFPVNASDFIDTINGWTFLNPANTPNGYYWSDFRFKDTMCVSSDFSIEYKLKVGAPNGISAYDTYVGFETPNGPCWAQLMGDAWGQPWTSVGVNGTVIVNNQPYLIFPNLVNWSTVKLEFAGGMLNFYMNGTLFSTTPYPGTICSINGLHYNFKGSGYCDWIKISNGINDTLYFEDFNNCNTIASFNNYCEPPIFSLSSIAPTCFNDTLKLFATPTNNTGLNYQYQWSGPNGFSSNLQNPILANPLVNANGNYSCNVSINSCISDSTKNINISGISNGGLSYSTISQSVCQGSSYLGYNSPGIYIDTLTGSNGCDSIRTLNLIVNPITYLTINQTICQPNSYLGYSASGTYIDSFQNQFGCDSIRTLNLIVNPITYSTINQSICQPNSYLGYNTSGTYIDTLLNVNGCDSVRTLNLIVKPMSFSSLSQTICQGQSYLGHSTSGVFNDTLLNAQGCDSVRTLTLTVNPVQQFTINQTICQPNSYLGYNTSGIYIDTFQNQFGCDSIRTLNLIVNPITYSTINQSICQPNSYLGYNTSGTYIDTILNANGCDSVRTLNLIVNPTTASTIIDTICEGFNVFGYTTTGTYVDVLANSNGCDSTRTLQLFVKPKTYSIINYQICLGDSYLGYSVQGQYKDTFVNVNGCDSIRTLNLIVHPTYFIDTAINLCNGDSLYCASAWQKIAGIYWDSLLSVYGCDSIVKTTLSFSKQLNPVILGNKEFCVGDSILLTVNNFNHYLWNTGDTTSWIYAKTSGQYSVIVNNEGLCFGYDTVNVIVNPLPNVSIQFTQKDLCKYDTIQLNALGANTYSWYSPNQSRLIGNSNPLDFSIYNSPVTVLVKGVDNNNCVNYDSVTLYYINCCGSIFVPNAFSPNGDGHNDKFKPVSNQVKYEGYEMKVFNRFGQMVYHTTDMQKGWDGTFKENQCDIGTYYYLIKTKCFESNENKILNGDINLLR